MFCVPSLARRILDGEGVALDVNMGDVYSFSLNNEAAAAAGQGAIDFLSSHRHRSQGMSIMPFANLHGLIFDFRG